MPQIHSIIKSPRAKADLLEIWDYIADNSETRADTFIDSLDKTLHTLAGQPDMGRMRHELEEGLRSFPIGRYIVFYRPTTEGIEVVRVLHSALDLTTIFQTDNWQ
jgi:toxin ParE1/3/4